jgi:hypothetical protein
LHHHLTQALFSSFPLFSSFRYNPLPTKEAPIRVPAVGIRKKEEKSKTGKDKPVGLVVLMHARGGFLTAQ